MDDEYNEWEFRRLEVIAPDYEAPTDSNSDNIYEFRVIVTDGQFSITKNLSITVEDADDFPTSLNLSNASVTENLPHGTWVGYFSAIGGNAGYWGDEYSYSLVAGNGDADNESFSISNNQLLAKKSFDYETKNSYSIRVRVKDASSGSLDKSFTISIGDAEENAPPVIDQSYR